MANEFLPFALDSRANVMRPASWAEDRDRERGFSAGPARSAKINTLHRQSAFVTAAIAQYIADSIGEDVLDNGNLQTFLDQFRRALGTRQQILTNDLDLYVATTGSDDNIGTQDRPFRTLQHAADVALTQYAIGTHTVNIRVAEGTYDDGVSLEGPITPGPKQLNFIGDASDPSRVFIAKASSAGACFEAGNGATYTITGFTLQNATAAQFLGGTAIGTWEYGSIWAYNIHFGTCTNAFIEAWNSGVGVYNDIRVFGNTPYFVAAYAGGNVEVNSGSIIFLGAPTIPVFVSVSGLSRVWFAPIAFAGGPDRGTIPYRVSQNSLLSTTVMLPGTEPPEVSSGGLYIGPESSPETQTTEMNGFTPG